MRRTLPIASLFISLFFGNVYAQMTTDNMPEIGESLTLYVLDSAVVDYASVTGEDVVWDYSYAAGYPELVKQIEVVTAAGTPADTAYINSDYAIVIDGFSTTYFTHDEDMQESQGYVFFEPSTARNVVVVFEETQPVFKTFPFDLNSSASSVYDGFAATRAQGNILKIPLSGEMTTTIDGIGTLILAENTYENVYRYKIEEYGTSVLPFFGEGELNRVQYEYYDYTISDLPIFIYSSVVFNPMGDDPMVDLKLVMSIEVPTRTLNAPSEKIAQTRVYPNPVQNELNIISYKGNKEMSIYNSLGKVFETWMSSETEETLDISSLNEGVYFLQINGAEGSQIIKFVK